MDHRTLLKDLFLIALFTTLVLLVHGYHLGIEDEAIYLPAIKKLLNPNLFPHDAAFFVAQTKFTLFDELIALLVGLTHAPLSMVLFSIHILSIFLVLWGCLQLSRLFFREPEAQWAAGGLVAALLTIPVTGTALYVFDQHLHPRSLSTVAVLFALAGMLQKKYVRSALFFLIGGLIHPQMTFYGVMFAFFLKLPPFTKGMASVLPVSTSNLPSPAELWAQIKTTRIHHYPLQWPWYEWLGIVAPPALLLWYGSLRLPGCSPLFTLVSRRLAGFGLLNTVLTILITVLPPFQKLVNLQPMRSYQLIYLLFFLLTGGLLGGWILKRKPLRWAILFIPLSLGMFMAQRAEFPASPHIELPGVRVDNEWIEAFVWIRENTPEDAFFALDPQYMKRPGADFHGFRALAERSMMADYVKDVAVAALSIAAGTIGVDRAQGASSVSETWAAHMIALRGWNDFRIEDFRRLKDQFGVNWVLVEKPAAEGLACLYENSELAVCRVD